MSMLDLRNLPINLHKIFDKKNLNFKKNLKIPGNSLKIREMYKNRKMSSKYLKGYLQYQKASMIYEGVP